MTMNHYIKLLSVICLTILFTTTCIRAGQIHEAVAAGDLDKVKALLEADPSLLESKDNESGTPLMTACSTLQVEVVNYLIDNGANVNAKGRVGVTPLFCFPSDKEIPLDLVQRLIDKGADVNAKLRLNRNWTVLVDYVVRGNIKMAKFLIEHGADPNVRDIEGTVVHMAMHHYWPICDDMADNLKLNEEMAKALVESGAKLQEFSFGNTELHLAGIRGLPNLVPVLVKYGANVNAMNDYGHTPLFYAARHGHRKVVEALIAAGADKNAIVETNYGKAPQLTEPLKEGEAYLWNMISRINPNVAYVVKTKNNLLIFNPYGINESLEAGLANGNIDPQELAGQKITVLNCYKQPQHGKLDISKLAQAIPGANFVFCEHPTVDDESNGTLPPYHLATVHKSLTLDGIKVHPIPACQSLYESIPCFGYLVEADGVKVFHAVLHASKNNSSQVEQYRQEIDFLKSFGPIDIAILPIKGRHINVAYEPYLYLIDQLSPKVIYLISDDEINEEPRKCIEVLKAREVPVFYPDGGIAVGQRFRYPAPEPSEFKDLKGDYLGQTPPGDIPVVFAPGIIATEDLEHSPAVFSPDGDEVYWITARPPGPGNRDWINREMTMRRIGNRWTAPMVSPYKGMLVFSPDGHRGYFWSDNDRDIFVIEKQGDCWSQARCLNILKQYPELKLAVDPSVTKDGSLYFMGIAEGLGMRHDYAIYRAKLIDGKYAKPELLPRSINLPGFQSWTPFVAPDESYLIFSSDRSGQFGGGDLYISFHDINADVWSESVNMGEKVNSRTQERLPGVSPDGKYLFFTRWIPGRHDDIHWVSAGIIDKLKAKVIQEQHLNIETPKEKTR